MKFSHVLPLAALSSALVLPSDEVMNQIAIEDHRHGSAWLEDALDAKDAIYQNVKEHVSDFVDDSKNSIWSVLKKTSQTSRAKFDEAFEHGYEVVKDVKDDVRESAFEMESWLDSEFDELVEGFGGGEHEPPHHGPPGRGRRPPHGPPPHRGRPHHPPHDCKPNQTIYELISKSKYTSKFAKLVSEYDDIVDFLNTTNANWTLFAPTNSAFEKIPKHHPKPSKEQLKSILLYHIVPEVYSAGRVLKTHTVPTLLTSDTLAASSKPQRLSFKLSLRGVLVNFYTRVVAVNIFATNGVIHGVDHIIIPPPAALKIIGALPGEFSTLELGLAKTGLLEKPGKDVPHNGGTLFAPSNWAFRKLGPRINAFLFSDRGEKYLKALLEYHVAPERTLYSDAYYGEEADKDNSAIIQSNFHVDLPTALKSHSLSVDVARWGSWITIKINGFTSVSFQDVVAKDGVVHVVSSVLIPPRQLPSGVWEEYQGEELEVEDLMERLDALDVNMDL